MDWLVADHHCGPGGTSNSGFGFIAMITSFLGVFAMFVFPDSFQLLGVLVVAMFGVMLVDLIVMNVLPFFKNRQ